MRPRHPVAARYLVLLAVLAGVWAVETSTLVVNEKLATAAWEAWTLVGLNVVFALGFAGAALVLGRSKGSLDFTMVLLAVHALVLALFALERFTYFLPYHVLVMVHHVPLMAGDVLAVIGLGVARWKFAGVRRRSPWVNPRPAPAPMFAGGSRKGWFRRREHRAPPIHVALGSRYR